MRIAVLVVAAVLAVALVVTTATGLVLLRRPLPSLGGEVRLEGLRAEVEVLRDGRGVPQIFAEDARDLFRAQGYVHAQDRFFEMDYRRRVAAGRLAELVGADEQALASDAVVRTLGWRRVAAQELDLLSPRSRDYLEAYADGVNDYLARREASQLGVEYSVLGLATSLPDIEPWSPVDSLAWLKAVAWEMRANDAAELERAATFSIVDDVDRVEEIFPAYPDDRNPTVLPAGSAGQALQVRTKAEAEDMTVLGGNAGSRAVITAATGLSSIPPLLGGGDGIGSNAWVVSGELTQDGAPILASDPHFAVSAPGPWYQVGLRCRQIGPECPFDVAGFGFAGLPGVVVGHNADLAWSMSALGADVADLFLERVFDDGTHLRDGVRVPLTQRDEVIRVNGGEDVRLTIRSTAHGPIVSDVLPQTGEARDVPVPPGSPVSGLRGFAVALGWTALTPGRTFDAFIGLNLARTGDDVSTAAQALEAPAVGIVYATTSGDIGFQAAGVVPQRALVPGAPVPSDGRWPRPGWNSAYDWVGTVAFEDLPAGRNPASGFIVAANQAVLPAGAGPALGWDWDAGYRAARITQLLQAAIDEGGPLTRETMAAIQVDVNNPYAEILVPYLLRVNVGDPFIEQGVALLRRWDHAQTSDSAAAAYFASVWTNLLRLTFWDDVHRGFEPDGGSRWLEVVRLLLEDPQSAWWDDRSTLNVVETRDEVLTQALTSARLQLTSSIGKDPTRWQWSKLHQVAPQHPVLGQDRFPGLIRNLVNPRPLAVDGGTSIVQATAWPAQTWEGDFPSFSVVSAPSMRMVVPLGDVDAATWVNVTGNSGHPASRHYTDQFAAWADGRSYPWLFGEEAVREAAAHTLRLVPAEE